jgi:hypothetical protein
MAFTAHMGLLSLKRRGSCVLLFLSWLCCFTVPASRCISRHHYAQKAEAGEWILTFRGTSTNPADYTVEFATAVLNSPWHTHTNTPVLALGSGVFEARLLGSADLARFFRVLSSGAVGQDSDFDSLSDQQEVLRGTNPADPDTDDDGFGDGIEVANSTNPLDAQSQPPLGVLTDVSFDQSTVTISEGDGVYLARVVFGAPFRGTIYYHVATNSTATSTGPEWDYEPLSTSLRVDGTEAVIPIHLIDDLRINGTRLLNLGIDLDPLCRYRPGGGGRQLIQIEDNDGYWTGTLRDVYVTATATNIGYSELGFRLKLLRSAGKAQASFVNDGRTDTSVRGSGCIPIGEWPAETALSSNALHVVSVPMALPPLPLFGNAMVDRTLRLSAHPEPRFIYRFGPNYIVGDYSDEILARDRSQSYLDRTNNDTQGIVAVQNMRRELFDADEREKIAQALQQIRTALAWAPCDRELRHAYLDVFYDRLLAETQLILKGEKAELSAYRLGLLALQTDQFIIDKEIEVYTNLLERIRAALVNYGEVLSDYGGVDVSTVDATAPAGTRFGYYLFQQEQPLRAQMAARFLDSDGAERTVPDLDPQTGRPLAPTTDERVLFAGYKDFVGVITLLRDYAQNAAELARLYGMRGRKMGSTDDIADGLALISQLQQEVGTELQMFVGMFPPDAFPSGDASGARAAINGVQLGLAELAGVGVFSKGAVTRSALTLTSWCLFRRLPA